MLNFMDAFSGYNQVRMNPEDIAKIAFITHRAVYAFIMMPFGLINAGATYPKMMNTIFKSQMGRNIESYVDDMISKSLMIPDHIKDLKECFDNLRRYNMKLNPKKCAFRVPSGKFLGFLVSERGIEANSEKINAIIEMKIPRTQKDIQIWLDVWWPSAAIKAQALAEFVIECTFPEQQPPASHELTQEEANPGTDCWKFYVDGSSTSERSRAGLILISPEGFTIQQVITFAFKATNNQAKYEALISGHRLAKSLGISKMVIYSDSQIVVKQTNGEYIVKDPTLAQYQAMVQNILGTTPDITKLQINRKENSKADELSKLMQNTSDLTSSVYFEELEAPNTAQFEVLCIGSTNNWMTPYIVYLRDRTHPEDQNKARYLKHKAAHFFLKNG
ncbi:uncharacterized protein LOC141685532 [Apium graveolens]|uniref:uncharacterized protein LOC141685532 n=1 Tax=Apium graveolens TaxID=4045 RepID=UPI003D79CEC3